MDRTERGPRALELRLQGKKWKEIAADLGCCTRTAYVAARDAAKRADVPWPRPKKPKPQCPRCGGPIDSKARRCRACQIAERKNTTHALCARCDRWKPHAEFGPAYTGRGLRLWCRSCEYEAVLERGRREPQKKAARAAVAFALRSGKLKRGPCELRSLGGCRGRIEAHHDDYERKLDVRWVCAGHHPILDRENKIAA